MVIFYPRDKDDETKEEFSMGDMREYTIGCLLIVQQPLTIALIIIDTFQAKSWFNLKSVCLF